LDDAPKATKPPDDPLGDRVGGLVDGLCSWLQGVAARDPKQARNYVGIIVERLNEAIVEGIADAEAA
jgi:hypothetical protein